MQLVGATKSFIRKPFINSYTRVGLYSAIVSVIFLLISINQFSYQIEEIDFYSLSELMEKCKKEEQIFSGSFLHLFRYVAPRLVRYSKES